MNKKKKRKTSDAIEILEKELIADNPRMEALLAEEESNLEIADQIYMLRMKAGLTHKKN